MFMNLDFTEYGNMNVVNPCMDWIKNYSYVLFIYRLSFLIVVLLNVVAQEIFIRVARLEGSLYTD